MPAPMTTTRARGGDGGHGAAAPWKSVAYYATHCAMRNTARVCRTPRPCQAAGEAGPRGRTGYFSQASTLSGLSSIHFCGGVVRGHAVLGDVRRDQVLVLVGPGEVLDQVDGRGAGLGELLGDQLVELVRRVVAVDLRRVGVAALLVGRQRRHAGGPSRRRTTAARRSRRAAASCSPPPSGSSGCSAASLPPTTTLKSRSGSSPGPRRW